jgi:hypothetical protein
VNILCGENDPVFVADGAKGETGAAGQTGAVGATGQTGATGAAGAGCTVARSWVAPYFGSAVITCGSTSVTIPDARISMYKSPLDYPSVCPGGAGQQINFYYDLNHNSMFDNDDEPSDNVYICDGVAGAQGIAGSAGSAGTSCSIASTTGGANVTCGSNTVFLANGANGTNASSGPVPTLYLNNAKIGPVLSADAVRTEISGGGETIGSTRVSLVRIDATNDTFLFDDSVGHTAYAHLHFTGADCTGTVYQEAWAYNSSTTIEMIKRPTAPYAIRLFDTKNRTQQTSNVTTLSTTDGTNCYALTKIHSNAYSLSEVTAIPAAITSLNATVTSWDIKVE